VCRDLLPSLRRASGEEARDLAGDFALEGDVFARSPFRRALALPRPRVLVSQALGFRLGYRGLLYQHALPFVTPPCAAEAHDDG
jgi:hypothetical protein